MARILIIDDDDLLFAAISRALHAYCTDLKAVSTGADALNEVASSFYDLCFLDIALPGLNGLDLLERIREVSPRTTVSVMTGALVDDEVRRKIEEHAFGFLAKPFDIFALKEITRQAMEKVEEESYPVSWRVEMNPPRKTVS